MANYSRANIIYSINSVLFYSSYLPLMFMGDVRMIKTICFSELLIEKIGLESGNSDDLHLEIQE